MRGTDEHKRRGTMKHPSNAQAAWQLARCWQRALDILKAGYSFWPDEELESVAVCKPGRLYAHYLITRGVCDCPDYGRNGDYCKHTLAYEEHQRNQALCEEYDGDTGEEFDFCLAD